MEHSIATGTITIVLYIINNTWCFIKDDRWKEFPEFENMKEGKSKTELALLLSFNIIHYLISDSFSLDDSSKFANSLESLSDDCVDQLARLLKFNKGIQEDSLKGYKGWKRILMMILEWENESNFYTWQTAKLFREKLKKLLQHPEANTSMEDQEIIKTALAVDCGTNGKVITKLEERKGDCQSILIGLIV